jgi:uncharacterized DUF497 family protein
LHIEWNERKNKANIAKHGFDFADSDELFRGVLLVVPETRDEYGEERWAGIGTIRGRVVVAVFTEISPDQIRMISLRKANSYEAGQYAKALQNELETD